MTRLKTQSKPKTGASERTYLFALITGSILILCLQFPGLFKGQVISSADLALYHPPYSATALHQPRSYASLSDFMDGIYPYDYFAYKEMHHGILPFFSNQSEAGLPFLWNGDNNLGNPFFLMLLYIFNPIYAPSLFLLLITLIGITSFFKLMRSFRVSPLGSTFAALVFGFNSYTSSTLQGGMAFNAYMLMPLLMLSTYKILKTPKLTDYFLFILAFIGIVTNGYPPSCLFFGIFYVFFLTYLWCSDKQLRKFKSIVQFVIASLCSVAIAIPMIFQTYHYLISTIDRTWRAGYGLHTISVTSFFSLLDPLKFGQLMTFGNGTTFQYVRDGLYFGTPALIIFAIGIYSSLFNFNRSKFVLWLAGYDLSLLCLITLPFLNRDVYAKIPLLSQTYASNQFVILIFVASLICGFGFDSVQELTIKTSTKVAVCVLILLLFLDGAMHKTFPSIYFCFILIISIYGINKIDRKMSSSSAFLIVIIPQLLGTFPLNGFINWTASPSQLYPESNATRYLQTNIGNYKLLPMGNAFLADTPYAFDIPTLAGRGHFSAGQRSMYRQLSPNAFKNSPTQYLFSTNEIDFGNPLLDVLGVKYVAIPTVGFKAVDNPETVNSLQHMKKVFSGDGVDIFKRPNPSEFGEIFTQCDSTSSGFHMTLQTWDVSRISTQICHDTHTINTPISFKGDLNLNRSLSLSLLNTGNSGGNSQFFVTSYTFDSNIKVKINGAKVNPMLADSNLLAIKLLPGLNVVVLKYDPWYLNFYPIFSLLALFIMLSGLLIRFCFIDIRNK